MIVGIQGSKYNFELFAGDEHPFAQFYIKAICTKAGRSSSINNLNTVLSELQVNPERPEYADSTWEIKRKKALYFLEKIKKSLIDKAYLEYLEQELDKDRTEGEWENIQ